MNVYKLKLAMERALRSIRGDRNLLSLPDSEIVEMYKHTRLDNYTFCNFASNLCKRSAGSIRAYLILKHVYRIQKKPGILQAKKGIAKTEHINYKGEYHG